MGKARTRPNILRVVLGSYVQNCPCEAVLQKRKSELKEIELSYCHHSICPCAKSGIWPILCQLMAIFVKLVDMGFKFVLPRRYINFDIQNNFEVNQTQIGLSIPKKSLKWPYLKTSFCPSVIHQKAYSFFIFQ